ncbi:MAG: Sensory transduction histidine kinase [Anaerolineae bacterium]|jgi:two-component system NtrC family sensor kinase|nr:MAG: Sensory transduction histidine kinase [Anaerolineae bacterium]
MVRSKLIALFIADDSTANRLTVQILQPAGYQVERLREENQLKPRLQIELPNALIVDDSLSSKTFRSLCKDFPVLPIIYYTAQATPEEILRRYQDGFQAVLTAQNDQVQTLLTVNRAVQRQEDWQKWLQFEHKRHTQSLEQRVEDLERLHRIGGKISASLHLDQVLKEVVIAAVELTDAEEGNLMLLDQESGNLILRAAHSVGQQKTDILRIPIYDTLLGEVIRTRKAVILSGGELTKIKTAFLVRALIYVPLMMGDQSIGVLGIYNRQREQPFSEYHLMLLEALADYAAIAIQNAHYYTANERERQKYHTILTNVRDGVLVLDSERRILLINEACQNAFGLQEQDCLGKTIDQVISNQDLILMLRQSPSQWAKGGEIRLDDGRIWNCQLTPIPEVGLAITMHDITHLKELDRVKSEFVSAVSHDLRSPLTAILGYSELIGRVGPLNERQREFIRRVQTSVQGITALISDLLDLGRIEAGLDARKELIDLRPLIRQSLENLNSFLTEKGQKLEMEISPSTPLIWGNPVRIQQMITNLVNNAIKYTPKGGKLGVRSRQEDGQAVLQVWDQGVGIPPAEQPYIFDKFYRASNLPEDAGGTGLGLTIVKSIVEDHQGRIWVESTPGQGTTFTIVLPAAEIGESG